MVEGLTDLLAAILQAHADHVYIDLSWVVFSDYVLSDLEGWASLIGVVLLLGGMQLTFLGVIGEYVGRIFEETKGRPVYLLKQATAPRGLSKDEWNTLQSDFLQEPVCAPSVSENTATNV